MQGRKASGRGAIRLYLTFGREVAAAALVVTALCVWWVYDFGMGALVSVLSFKLTMIALTLYFADAIKKKQYYYYYNLGFSKKRLWGMLVAADMLLFSISISATAIVQILLRHASYH